MSSKTRQQLEAWAKTIEVSGNILDVGGSQKPAHGRVQGWGDHKFVILDLENPHEDSSKPDIAWDLNNEMSLTDIDSKYVDDNFCMDNFDYALCFEVAEYWWNPFCALMNINKFLKLNGKLYMSVPFVYPVHNPKDQDCLRYTDVGISRLLENAGFRVDKITPRIADSSDILRGFYGAEGMKPSKEYGSHDSVGWLIEATKI